MMTKERIAEIHAKYCAAKDNAGFKYPYVMELLTALEEAQATIEQTNEQTKELVNLYFEGCDADTFDDAVRALRKELGGAR